MIHMTSVSIYIYVYTDIGMQKPRKQLMKELSTLHYPTVAVSRQGPMAQYTQYVFIDSHIDLYVCYI